MAFNPYYGISSTFGLMMFGNKQFSKAKDKFELMTVPGLKAGHQKIDANLTPFIYPFSMTWRLNIWIIFSLLDSGDY